MELEASQFSLTPSPPPPPPPPPPPHTVCMTAIRHGDSGMTPQTQATVNNLSPHLYYTEWNDTPNITVQCSKQPSNSPARQPAGSPSANLCLQPPSRDQGDSRPTSLLQPAFPHNGRRADRRRGRHGALYSGNTLGGRRPEHLRADAADEPHTEKEGLSLRSLPYDDHAQRVTSLVYPRFLSAQCAYGCDLSPPPTKERKKL